MTASCYPEAKSCGYVVSDSPRRFLFQEAGSRAQPGWWTAGHRSMTPSPLHFSSLLVFTQLPLLHVVHRQMFFWDWWVDIFPLLKHLAAPASHCIWLASHSSDIDAIEPDLQLPAAALVSWHHPHFLSSHPLLDVSCPEVSPCSCVLGLSPSATSGTSHHTLSPLPVGDSWAPFIYNETCPSPCSNKAGTLSSHRAPSCWHPFFSLSQ